MGEGIGIKLAAVGYPAWAEADWAWVETIRRRHDAAKAAMIAAHVTFVFPTDLLAKGAFLAHLRDRLRGVAPIDFTLSAVESAPHDLLTDHHVFLLPERGRDALAALHDRLYAGPLTPALRLDLPYRPHVTVGRLADAAQAAAVADEIQRHGRVVGGWIEALAVPQCHADRVVPVAVIPLAGSAA